MSTPDPGLDRSPLPTAGPAVADPSRRRLLQGVAGGCITRGIALAALAGLGTATARDARAQGTPGGGAAWEAPTLTLRAVTRDTLTLTVTAGAGGAPSGFTVQWLLVGGLPTGAALQQPQPAGPDRIWFDGGEQPCEATYNGNAAPDAWRLGPHESVDIVIGAVDEAPGTSTTCGGAALSCDGVYAFRAFARAGHGARRSAPSAVLVAPMTGCLTG